MIIEDIRNRRYWGYRDTRYRSTKGMKKCNPIETSIISVYFSISFEAKNKRTPLKNMKRPNISWAAGIVGAPSNPFMGWLKINMGPKADAINPADSTSNFNSVFSIIGSPVAYLFNLVS
ncbi:MAG: hypothetical protein GY754_04710 [bacterium]|nr:hypothetical protein [bacterium]